MFLVGSCMRAFEAPVSVRRHFTALNKSLFQGISHTSSLCIQPPWHLVGSTLGGASLLSPFSRSPYSRSLPKSTPSNQCTSALVRSNAAGSVVKSLLGSVLLRRGRLGPLLRTVKPPVIRLLAYRRRYLRAQSLRLRPLDSATVMDTQTWPNASVLVKSITSLATRSP